MKDKYADQLLEEMVDRYASPLLSWAYRKTGSSLEAQDLSQEVLLQVTAAVRRETDRGHAVEQPEHLLWKVAHYVWCRHRWDACLWTKRCYRIRRILPPAWLTMRKLGSA